MTLLYMADSTEPVSYSIILQICAMLINPGLFNLCINNPFMTRSPFNSHKSFTIVPDILPINIKFAVGSIWFVVIWRGFGGVSRSKVRSGINASGKWTGLKRLRCGWHETRSPTTVRAEIIETCLIGAAPTQLFLTLYKLTKNAPPLA